jgi:hypothetical protein
MQRIRRLFMPVALACALLFTQAKANAATPGPEGLADGPGIWVNMWNYPQGDVQKYCEGLHSKGIRNLFIQTSRSNTEAICHPDKLGPLIDACHFYKIRVIAWSFAELDNPSTDADKLIAAGRFLSPTGQHLDALAANMEKNLDQVKVEAYSSKLRKAVGPSFPLVAVVYSPLNGAPQVAHIPWKTLDHYYDVIAPMNYWNSKYKKLDPYQYTMSTIQTVRELVGRPDVEIHVIGDGMGTHSDSITQFLKACQDGEATSASIYPNFKMTAEQMDCISQYSGFFPVNARFRLAAFRELLKQGTLSGPNNNNPATPIARGEFYKMIVRQLYPNKYGSELSPQEALALLTKAGAVGFAVAPEPAFVDELLYGPMAAKEAFSIVARLIDKNGELAVPKQVRAGKPAAPLAKKRGGWFVQPAFAAEEKGIQPLNGAKPIDYMDAAQIVLQASSGLR